MTNNKEIYLDNAATTKIYDEVINEITENLKQYYNPSSFYKPAVEIEQKIEKSRKQLGDLLGFYPEEIYFTSSATESNNTIIKGIVEKNRTPFNIITTQIEHPSVIEVFKDLENKNIETRYIPVDSYGNLDLEWLENNIDENTALVSVMAVNNEIGTILDLENVKRIIDKKNPNTILHTDYVQAFLKNNDSKIDLKKIKPDAVTITAHKIHGPKGIGVLALRRNKKVAPLLHGGGQERGFRSGTENVAHIIGFAKAAEIGNEKLEANLTKAKELKERLLEGLSKIDGVHINSPENSIDNLLNISIDNIRAEVLLHMLEGDNIFISSGSACSTHHKSNYIHKALGYDSKKNDETIRISTSEFNTIEDIDKFLVELEKSIKDLRKILGFKKR